MEALEIGNGLVSLFTALVLSWLVLSPKIHEGLWIKAGMICMAMSLLVTAWHTLAMTRDYSSLWAAALVLRTGLLVVCIGLIMRRTRCDSWGQAFDMGSRS